MGKINYKQDAIGLAKDLLGRVICYKEDNGKEYKKYMITVTEAYPYKEEKDENGNEISYVNRYKSGAAHDVLTNENEIGTWFTWSDMLHVACGGGETKEGEYRCGNVLIRGGILIKNDICQPEKKELNYKDGQPTILCKEKLKMLTGKKWSADKIIKDDESVSKI